MDLRDLQQRLVETAAFDTTRRPDRTTSHMLLGTGILTVHEIRAALGQLPPPGCCGHTGHQPAPGIGCTTTGCLCLEPADLTPQPTAGRVWIGAY